MKTPSEHFKLKVLGKITTKVLKGTMTDGNGKVTPHNLESSTYEFIDENENSYMTNVWYKEYKKVPLVILKEFVDKIELKNGESNE